MKRKKTNLRKILFLIFVIFYIFFAYLIFNKNYQKIEKMEVKKEEVKKDFSKNLNCDLNQFYKNIELKKIEQKHRIEERKKRELAKKKKEAELSKNKTLIISTSSRGKDGLGYYYAFGDGFMFRSGEISSGKKNYETPIGDFDLKYKKKYAMSNLYPDPSGINNMDDQIGITNYGIALHKGNPNQLSHGCVHINPNDSAWLFDWVDDNTKIVITNKADIDYKNLSLDNLILDIEKYNAEEKRLAEIEEEEITFWENGNKKTVRVRKLGRLEGPQYTYYKNGKIKSIHNYYHNRKDGWQYDYYPNEKKRQWKYIAGGKIWEILMWNKKGEMIFYYNKTLEKK